jgi:hypothetical protein
MQLRICLLDERNPRLSRRPGFSKIKIFAAFSSLPVEVLFVVVVDCSFLKAEFFKFGDRGVE